MSLSHGRAVWRLCSLKNYSGSKEGRKLHNEPTFVLGTSQIRVWGSMFSMCMVSKEIFELLGTAQFGAAWKTKPIQKLWCDNNRGGGFSQPWKYQ